MPDRAPRGLRHMIHTAGAMPQSLNAPTMDRPAGCLVQGFSRCPAAPLHRLATTLCLSRRTRARLASPGTRAPPARGLPCSGRYLPDEKRKNFHGPPITIPSSRPRDPRILEARSRSSLVSDKAHKKAPAPQTASTGTSSADDVSRRSRQCAFGHTARRP
jgi:hypothetical protein